ncbi:acyltransferase [Mariniblastus sp.]|nr:acyltransferase [Mariniblastus sp.]
MNFLKSALTRETSGQKLIPQIDGLRFVAIVSVVAFHVNGFVASKSSFYQAADYESDWLCRFMAEGHMGVQLFFVISGFILGLPFAKHYLASGPAISMKRYFVRRLVRLEPPYLIAMTLIFIALIVSKGLQNLSLLPNYIASMFYVHYFFYGQGSRIIAAAWSLEIEVQFYLLAPLLGHVFRISSTRLRRTVLVLSILICGLSQLAVTYPTDSPMHGWTILSSFHWFFTGLLLTDLYVSGNLSTSEKPIVWDVFGIFAAILSWCIVYSRFHIHLFLPFLILCSYAAAFKGRYIKAALSIPAIYILGGMCYTIYLYHSLIKALVGRFSIKMQLGFSAGTESVAQFLVISIFIVLICSILFVITEKPFMSRNVFQKVLSFLDRSEKTKT